MGAFCRSGKTHGLDCPHRRQALDWKWTDFGNVSRNALERKVRHWRSLEGHAHHVHSFFESLPPSSLVLDDYVRFLYHVGEQSLPESFTITGLCGQMLFDPAITLSRDSDPKLVTCRTCKSLLKKQQAELREVGLTPEPGPGPKVGKSPRSKPNTDLIYELGGITEFARLALNEDVGCVHGCKYCYGPASMHVSRKDWTTPREKENYLTNLLFTLALTGSSSTATFSLTDFGGSPRTGTDCWRRRLPNCFWRKW
jgi:hypothetical protein